MSNKQPEDIPQWKHTFYRGKPTDIEEGVELYMCYLFPAPAPPDGKQWKEGHMGYSVILGWDDPSQPGRSMWRNTTTDWNEFIIKAAQDLGFPPEEWFYMTSEQQQEETH